ncbi:DUF881 domain-containing protein [Oryzobacter telluris]|uniref:DUF881 domain-containing protein n=1 Tax=Oryzobacter telluris TaxID=3149179 RepID=UPI00370D4796
MSPAVRTPSGRRPDASMTLLTAMLERPLDPGYAASADEREAAGLPRSTSLRSPRLVVATVLIGLVVGIASYNLTTANEPRSQARTDLIREIEQRRDQVDDLTARASSLQAEVTARESEQLSGDAAAIARGRELAAAVGSIPLVGPGFVLTLDDAPGAGADEGTTDETAEGRVFARDLQFVTNAMWEAGAEAISINGKRLTSTSAIRFAGSAIIVDYRPLARPYAITAIGDPKRFPADFADGAGGTYLSTLKSTFGVRVDTEVKAELTVPAAVGLTTRYARTGDTGAAPKGAASPSPTPVPEGSPS